MKLADKIPPIYHKILNEILEIKFPEEKIANCNSCNLCQSAKSPYSEVKCCNYFPIMPNFMLGGILSDPDPSLKQGKIEILNLIAHKKGITPYGILPNKKYKSTQNEIFKKKILFSNKEDTDLQKCPYLFEGNCSVWKYREHLCVSFFCSSVGGKSGKEFWQKVDEFLNLIEQKLSKFVLQRLDWNQKDILSSEIKLSSFNFEKEDESIDELEYEKLWDKWSGREVDFYLTSYEIIKNLDEISFKNLIGSEYDTLVQSIQDSSKTFIENKFPDYLQLNPNIQRLDKKGEVVLVLNDEKVKIELIYYSFFKLFNGERTTVSVFHEAFKVLLDINEKVELFYKKNFLIEVKG